MTTVCWTVATVTQASSPRVGCQVVTGTCCSANKDAPAPREFRADGPLTFFSKLLDTSDYPARWNCGTWTLETGWLHIVSDLAIFGAYCSIPLAILFFLRRRKDAPCPALLGLFAAFILACGIGHLVEATMFWWPAYRLSGVLKAVTATVSWVTALAAIRVIPEALKLPGVAALNAELRERESLLNKILQANPAAIYWTDERGSIIGSNLAFARLSGEEEDSGASRDPRRSEQWIAALQRADLQVISTGEQVLSVEETAHLPDGERVLSSSKIPFWDASGRVTGVLGIAQDITETVLARREVEAANHRFERLMHSDVIGIMLCDLDGRITQANDALLDLLGYDRRDVEYGELNWKQLTAPEWHARDAMAVRELLETGEAKPFEKEYLSSAGARVPVLIGVTLLDGDDASCLCFVLDMSEQKRVSKELSAAKDDAEAASRAKSEFLASMSHELRTPLNGVVGMAELLAGTDTQPVQEEFIAAINNNASSLLSLINDILDFSKIEADRLTLEEVEFDLHRLFNDVTDATAAKARGKSVELTSLINHRGRLTLIGDSVRLRQVLVNLVGNAVKFTNLGEVSLTAEVHVSADRRATITVSVEDTGIGIPSDRLDCLFESFSQVDASTTRQYGGTGLGLAISHRIVKAMGGDLRVESEPGCGSRFWFTLTLPLADPADAEGADWSEALKSMRVLVLQEHPHRRAEKLQLLESCGAATLEAESSEDASRLFDALQSAGEPVDAILLAAEFPRVDGKWIEELAREHPTLRNARLLYIQSSTETAPREPAAPVSQILLRPVNEAKLISALKNNPSGENVNREPLPMKLPPGYKALVVEDNATNQVYVREILKRSGAEVHLAVNGYEALRAVSNDNYDVVLMDCLMPEMDGFEATREIRRRERSGRFKGHVPIIALTANALQGDEQQCLQAGMDSYVAKPFRASELILEIQKVTLQGEATHAAAAGEGHALHAAAHIDCEALLDRCLRDAVFAMSLLDTFIVDSQQRVDELQTAADAADYGAYSSAAHSLKGVSGIAAAETLFRLSARAESAGNAGNIEQVQALVDQIRTETAACVDEAAKLQASLKEPHEVLEKAIP